MKFLIPSVLFFSLATSCFGQDADSSAIIGNLSTVSKSPAIKFTATTYCEQADDFRKANPDWAMMDRITTVYEGIIKDTEFQIKSTSHHRDLKTLPTFVATYDGNRYSYLDPMGKPHIITSVAPGESSLLVPLGTVILLPYEFLFETVNAGGMRFIWPDAIGSPTSLDQVKVSLASARMLQDDDSLQMRFNQPNGAYYLVIFSKKMDYRPVSFEKYNPNQKIQQRYRVTEFTSLKTPDGQILIFPKKAIYDWLVDGWHAATTTITLNDIKLAGPVDESAFVIDPASVDVIWDADHGIQIQVPH